VDGFSFLSAELLFESKVQYGTMVLVEEIFEEDAAPAQPAAAAVASQKATATTAAAAAADTAAEAPEKKPAMKRGFLESAAAQAEPLYPPEGSNEGQVAPETHKAHQEHKMNQDLNDQMNRGAKENNGHERPQWYTKEYPKDCQYNSPGCALHELPASGHTNDIKRGMVRSGERWKEATQPGVTAMRLSFMSLTDEDLTELLPFMKGNKDLVELDLSHNSIKDQGVQSLVGALANGAAPNLRELRLYSNEFGELGQTMLTQGLPVFRKKLEVHWKEPSWAKITKPSAEAAEKAPAGA